MTVDRRDFLKIGAYTAAGSMLATGLPAINAIASKTAPTRKPEESWAMVIDVDKCDIDCTACVDACHKENNVPDFPEPKHDVHWIRKITFKQKHVENGEERSLPAMCFHCEYPPCAHVCPVEATFVRKDGLVLVDKHRCIGCRYCMIACPYKARSFVSRHVDHKPTDNPDVPIRMHGVVEKCTFCAHLIDQGKEPACVTSCAKKGKGAMLFGDLRDEKSEVFELVRSGKANRIRSDLGLNPRVFYLGV